MSAPKKWKLAIVIWVAIYPLITTVFLLFGKILMQIEFVPLRTLVMTAILIPVMVFVLMPFLTRLLGNWLKK